MAPMALGLGLGIGFTNSSGGSSEPSFDWSASSSMFQDTAGTTPASANNDPVGSWDTGAFSALQSTAGARPLLATAGPRVAFDGSNDYLAVTGSVSSTIGSVIIAFRTGATAFSAAQSILSSADVGAANEWFEIGLTSEGKPYLERNAAGTKHTVVGSSFLDNSTDYILSIAFDDVDYYMQLGAVEQNPLVIESVGTPCWFGDVAGADNIVLGGTVTSAGLVRPFQGALYNVAIYSQDVTA